MTHTWHILSGEYPPHCGGVGDYTRLVARALAEAGDEVHVWTPRQDQLAKDDRVILHPLPGNFGPAALKTLEGTLARSPSARRRLLVQYVPHAFGWKGMNVALARWLWRNRRRHAIDVMFHEVAFPLRWRQPVRHVVLAVVQRLMARLAAGAAQRVFVAIPGWTPLLQGWTRDEPIWLPVPSNLPTEIAPERREQVRRRLTGGTNRLLIGHFGTYGPEVSALLGPALAELLWAEENRFGLLLGRGSEEFARRWKGEHPAMSRRVHAAGYLAAEELAAHLASCDVLLQPYPDGASSRRGSLMAGLGLGLPIVTTEGILSEPLWRQSDAIQLVPPDVSQLVAGIESLLSSAKERVRLSAAATELYQRCFALEKTIQRLRTGLRGDQEATDPVGERAARLRGPGAEPAAHDSRVAGPL
jgi:glycosyltransferase involved in cell wall biosynthesis